MAGFEFVRGNRNELLLSSRHRRHTWRTRTLTNRLRTTGNVHSKGFVPLRMSHGATDRVYFWYFLLLLLVLVDTYTHTPRPTWNSSWQRWEHIVASVDWHGGVEFEADGCSGEIGCV